jgi:hypothetical protein
MMLCDHAAVADGKLYINGGGWSTVLRPDMPTPMGIAVKALIPWDQTNMQHTIVIELRDEDGQAVLNPDGQPWRADGTIEVGRPPGLKPGTAIDAPMAVFFPGIALATGGYMWTLEIDGAELAAIAIRVL